MYVPDAREVGDERVYAQNVRDHMAKWLHVGTVDESVGMTNSGKGFRRTDLGRTGVADCQSRMNVGAIPGS